MNEQRASELAEQLTSATTGWSPASVASLIELLMEWTDEDAAENAVWWACHNWAERSHPPFGWLYRAYNDAREAERRAADSIPEPTATYEVAHPKRGREVAFEMYRSSLGLPDDQDTRDRFRVGGIGAWGPFVEQDAPAQDAVTALAAINEGAMYVDVLRAFRGQHLLAGRALRSLEKSGRITHRPNGWITPR